MVFLSGRGWNGWGGCTWLYVHRENRGRSIITVQRSVSIQMLHSRDVSWNRRRIFQIWTSRVEYLVWKFKSVTNTVFKYLKTIFICTWIPFLRLYVTQCELYFDCLLHFASLNDSPAIPNLFSLPFHLWVPSFLINPHLSLKKFVFFSFLIFLD